MINNRFILRDSLLNVQSEKSIKNDPYDMSYLLKRMRIKRPIKKRILFDRPIDQYTEQTKIKSPKTLQTTSHFKPNEKLKFNHATYCFAYCTIIIIGKPMIESNKNHNILKIKGMAIGGWIGGLFEFISGGYNGCYNEHRGHEKCQKKYASFNATTNCINIFYSSSKINIMPYICLCRYRNNSLGKYRNCEFLHSNIE